MRLPSGGNSRRHEVSWGGLCPRNVILSLPSAAGWVERISRSQAPAWERKWTEALLPIQCLKAELSRQIRSQAGAWERGGKAYGLIIRHSRCLNRESSLLCLFVALFFWIPACAGISNLSNVAEHIIDGLRASAHPTG